MTSEQKTRKQKAIQPWVVGQWDVVENSANEGGVDVSCFIPLDHQPEEPITDLNKLVAWVKQNIGEPGTYEFVRKAPGRLVLAEQTTMKAVLEG